MQTNKLTVIVLEDDQTDLYVAIGLEQYVVTQSKTLDDLPAALADIIDKEIFIHEHDGQSFDDIMAAPEHYHKFQYTGHELLGFCKPVKGIHIKAFMLNDQHRDELRMLDDLDMEII